VNTWVKIRINGKRYSYFVDEELARKVKNTIEDLIPKIEPKKEKP